MTPDLALLALALIPIPVHMTLTLALTLILQAALPVKDRPVGVPNEATWPDKPTIKLLLGLTDLFFVIEAGEGHWVAVVMDTRPFPQLRFRIWDPMTQPAGTERAQMESLPGWFSETLAVKIQALRAVWVELLRAGRGSQQGPEATVTAVYVVHYVGAPSGTASSGPLACACIKRAYDATSHSSDRPFASGTAPELEKRMRLYLRCVPSIASMQPLHRYS